MDPLNIHNFYIFKYFNLKVYLNTLKTMLKININESFKEDIYSSIQIVTFEKWITGFENTEKKS